MAVAAAQLEVALRHPRTGEEWQRIARKALGEVRRTGRLVDALLRIVRSESGRVTDREMFDAGVALSGVLDSMAEAARARGVSVELVQVHPSMTALGDEDAVVAAVRALLDNATDHAREKVALTLEAAKGEVAIHVDDDGPGVTATERERIFEPFVRGKTLGDRTGLGLGLHVAKRLVAASCGTLAVADAPGGGARFTIRLAAPSHGRPETS